jgi:hypothetical protein
MGTCGTSWEQTGNKLGTYGNKRKKKKIPPLDFQKRKNWTCHESMLSLSLAAWNFYFKKSLSPYLAWANGMEQPQKRKKKKFPPSNPLPPPPLKRKKTGPLNNAC